MIVIGVPFVGEAPGQFVIATTRHCYSYRAQELEFAGAERAVTPMV